MEFIEQRSIKRAKRALRCVPLNSTFFKDVQAKGLLAENVFKLKKLYQSKETRWFKHSKSLEDTFVWLITLGVLRREVDGQGLTAKVRLTPLGRKILEENPQIPSQKAKAFEKINNYLYRKWLLK